MNRFRIVAISLLVVAALAMPALTCGILRSAPAANSAGNATPASGVTAEATGEAALLPSSTPLSPTEEPATVAVPTATATPRPPTDTPPPATLTPTPTPTKTATATATSTPTPVPTVVQGPSPTPTGPRVVVVTDADMESAVKSGVGDQSGVQTQGLAIHFTGGRVHITADQVSYGLFQVSNLVLVGVLVARDGALQMDTESISPQGMATAFIPTLVNQALRNYTSKWYVEDVHTSEGQIELTVR